jgi:hypothetical protein
MKMVSPIFENLYFTTNAARNKKIEKDRGLGAAIGVKREKSGAKVTNRIDQEDIQIFLIFKCDLDF